jgi:hypothetical protein
MDNMGHSAELSSLHEQIRMRFFTTESIEATEPIESAENEYESSTTDAPVKKRRGASELSAVLKIKNTWIEPGG